MEKWAPIEEFPLYEVSSEGNVRNRNTGQVLRPQIHKRSGLHMVFLRHRGRQSTEYIHRLVAAAFLHPAEFGRAPVHIDGDRTNNRADNLEWRSLSSAREISADRQKDAPTYPWAVQNQTTGVVYSNALEAAREIDGIEKYIILAAFNQSRYKGAIWAWY